MPYASEAQRRWAHTAEGKSKLGSKIHEFDEASKGMSLPERVKPRPRRYHRPEREKDYFARITGR